MSTHGVDLAGEQLDDMGPAFDDGAVVVLVHSGTVTGGLLSGKGAMTSMDLFYEEDQNPGAITEDDVIAFLEESFESTDIKFEVEAFSHPAAPAAVATYTVVEDDVDFHCRDYAVGAAAGVLAYLCTDPDQPEDRIAESDEIVRTIRIE